MSIVELNLKAKKYHLVPEVPLGAGLTLKLNTQYITNEGKIVGPINPDMKYPDQPDIVYIQQTGWYQLDGKYCGAQEVANFNYHIVREWFKTYKEYDAWKMGKKIEVLLSKTWYPVSFYLQVYTVYGNKEEKALKWWMEKIDAGGEMGQIKGIRIVE